MRSFLSNWVPSSSIWAGLYLLLAGYLLTHPPLSHPQSFAVVLGGGLVLFLFRGVPADTLERLGLPALAFLLYVLLSAVWSVSPGFSLRSAGFLFLAVLLYFMVRQNFPKTQDFIESVLLFMALAAAGMGLYQWFFGFGDLARLISQYSGVEADQLTAAVHNKRAFGPLVTSGALAALLIFFIPQVVIRYWNASGPSRIFQGLILLFLLAGLAATGSVGAWVCLALALVFLFWKQGHRRWVLGILLGSVLVVGLLLAYRGLHNWTLASYSMRLELWHSAWSLFLQHPWFGWGLGTFGEAYQFSGLPLGTGALYAHNLPLQLLVETGLAGTLLFVSALVSLLRRFQWPALWAGWGVMVGLMAVLLFSLMDLPFQMGELVWVFAAVAGRLEVRPGKKWELPTVSLTCAPWVLLGILFITGFWPPYRPWNFALLAVVLWVFFALFQAQIEGMKLWMGFGALHLALRAFNSPSASGTVWFLELVGLLIVFYQLLPRLRSSKLFLLGFAGLGLAWAVKLAWYCWHQAPALGPDWVRFQLTDVEPWIFYPNPKQLAVFLIPLLFLLPAQSWMPTGLKVTFGALSFLVVLRLKALGALVGLAAGWLWGSRKNWLKIFLGLALSGGALFVLRWINSSATKWDRFDIWRSALTVWSWDPIFGVGPGVFAGAFHLIQPPREGGYSHYLMDARYAHNEFLDLLVAFGLIGLIFVLLLFFAAWKRIQGPERKKALLGLGFAAFFDFCLHAPLISLLATGLASPEEEKETSPSWMGAFLVLGLGLGLFASPVWVSNLQHQAVDSQAARNWPAAVRYSSEASTLNAWDADLANNESWIYSTLYMVGHQEAWGSKEDEALARACDLEQADGHWVLEQAKRAGYHFMAYRTEEHWKTAQAAWARAEQAGPFNTWVFVQEGEFYAENFGQKEPYLDRQEIKSKALEAFERAVQLEPNFVMAWVQMGRFRIKAGDRVEGQKDLRTALKTYGWLKDAPGVAPEERFLIGLTPDQARKVEKEAAR